MSMRGLGPLLGQELSEWNLSQGHTGRQKGRSYGESGLKTTKGSNKDLQRRNRRHRKALTKTGCTVYGLRAKSDGVTMYVGQTRCLLEKRLRFHVRKLSGGKTNLYKWWRWRIQEGDAVEIFALDEQAIWDVSEIIWIERLRAHGNPLTNMTLGGRSGPLAKGGKRKCA